MTARRPFLHLLLILSASILAAAPAVSAEEPDCAACHEQQTSGKVVHPAISMGCVSCHSAVDASEVPHTFTNRNARGLAARIKDLCFSCHDRKQFTGTTVHGALMLGCTSCHDPHVSDYEHVLKQEIPGLCLNCHEERLTRPDGRTHVLAGNEACAACHNPHATNTPKLVRTAPTGTVNDRTALSAQPAVSPQ
ncbi:MAG: cytochrome c3 family protein [Nitrospirota bacterium]